MATYYVDPAATGRNSGSLTDPWTSLQSAADTAVAGDVVLCRGVQTLTTAITFSKNSGNITFGFIKYIGCNSSWENDGTLFELDGNNSSANGVYINGLAYLYFENIHVRRCTSIGFNHANSFWMHSVFNNCKASNNGSHGFSLYYDGSRGECNYYFKCTSSNNGGSGFYRPYRLTFLILCRAENNASYGVEIEQGTVSSVVFGCLVANNAHGIISRGGFIMANTVDGSTSGVGIDVISTGQVPAFIFGNRVTNNAGWGMSAQHLHLFGWNFVNGNTAGQITGNGYVELDAGVDSNLTSGTQGYVDRANGDYNLTSDAALRRTAITLPS